MVSGRLIVRKSVASVFAIIFLFMASHCFAQEEESHENIVARVNSGTVSVISGGIGGTYIRIAGDLASVLNDGDKLRILPIVGQGSLQNITDILYLRGIDIGIVQSDVLAFIRRNNLYRSIDERIAYITKLYNEEFHLVAAAGTTTIEALRGQKVNFGVKGSGTSMTASIVFESLGVEVEPVYLDQSLALEQILSGEIAATAYVAGKPTQIFREIGADRGLRLIPVEYTPPLMDAYLPASFSPDDYPGLIDVAEPVSTIAVGAVMAVYNWSPEGDRYKKVEQFVETFFSRFESFLQEPRHPKWREVNLAAELPGWRRFPPAAQWLERNPPSATGEARAAFDDFLQTNAGAGELSQEQREALFSQFVNWWRARQSQAN